jgi:hypothetical protein
MLTPRLRKVVLVTHVTTSVGWLGAVAAYLALDLATALSRDVQTLRAAYLAMDLIVRYVIVPLALATVVVGVINGLGTHWGLFRHYWVLLKLLLTLVASTVLLIESATINALARDAASGADPRELASTLPHSIGGLIVLLSAAVLSVFKPRGLTRFGWRKQRQAAGSARRISAEPRIG